MLEANLDDMNPQIYGYFLEKALAAGALDVFATPVQMKKNRPGFLITVLCTPQDESKFQEMLLRKPPRSAFAAPRPSAASCRANGSTYLPNLATCASKWPESTGKCSRLRQNSRIAVNWLQRKMCLCSRFWMKQ